MIDNDEHALWTRGCGRAFANVYAGCAGGAGDGFLGAVGASEGEIEHGREDRREEQNAGPEGPQVESAVLVGRAEEVTDVRTERAGEDEGDPERQHRAGA